MEDAVTVAAPEAPPHRSRFARTARHPLSWLFVFALVLTVWDYFVTYDKWEHNHVPRGDGQYRPFVAVQDGHMLYLQAMTVVFDRDLDLSNQVEDFGITSTRYTTADGRPYYPSPLASTLVWAPALAFAHGLSKIANLFGYGIADHGYSYFHQRVTFLTSPLLAWLACVLAFFVIRRILGGRFAPALAALAMFFGTNLYYYAVYRPDYGHAISACLGASFLGYWAITVGRRDRKRFVVLGALCGMVGLGRVTDLALGVVVAIELGWLAAGALTRPQWRAYLLESCVLGTISLAAALVAFFPQLVVWKLQCDSSLFGVPEIPGYMSLTSPRIADLLFSRMNGYFATHPLAYFGAVGLLMAPRRLRLVGLGIFVAGAAEVYLNSCAYDWHGIGSYGARRMVAMSLAVAVGLAFLFHQTNRLVAWLPGLNSIPAMAAHPIFGRTGVWLRRGLGLAFVSWFVIWNLSYAEPTRQRSNATPAPICCDELPKIMRKLSKKFYAKRGNPFAFPANVLFAYKWGVEIGRWDQAVTQMNALQPPLDILRKRAETTDWAGWNLAGVGMEPYLLSGYGPHQAYRLPEVKDPLYVRWSTASVARSMVPLFLSSDHEFMIPLFANIGPNDAPARLQVAVNGTVYFDKEFGFGWGHAQFTVPGSALTRGMNLLEIHGPEPTANRTQVEGAPKAGLPDHPQRRPVGVGIGMAQLRSPHPRR